MKELFRKEYLQRFNLIMKLELNGRNNLLAANTWAVSLMRYGAGILRWTKMSFKRSIEKQEKL